MPLAPGAKSIGPFKFTVVGPPGPPPDIFFRIFSTFSQNVSTSNAAGQNYRCVIPTASLIADTTDNQIRVQFQFGPVVSCTIASWIGTEAASGNAYNFSGDQVQLLFSGATSANCPNGGTLISDWAPFTTYLSSNNLIVSMYFTGTSVFPQEQGSLTGSSIWFLTAASQVGATAPTGSWGQSTPDVQGVMIIEMRTVTSLVALITSAMSNAFGNASALGAAAIRALATSPSLGRIQFSGAAPISARASATARIVANSITGQISLAARSLGNGSGRLAGTVKAALQTAARAWAPGRLALIGVVPLAARSAAMSAGRVTISIVIPLALAAMSSALGIGRAASTVALKLQSAGKSAVSTAAQLSGVVTLHAFGMGRVAGRITAGARASLQAITEAVSAARTASVGKGALASKAMARAVSTAAQSGIVPILARSAGMATGRGVGVLKLALQTAALAAGIGRTSAIGKVALAAKTLARSSTQAAISTLLAGMVAMIAASRGAVATGRAATVGHVGLLGSGKAAGAAKAAVGGAIGLRASALVRGIGRGAVAGVVFLTVFTRGIGNGVGVFGGGVQLLSRAASAAKARAAASYAAGLASISLGRGSASAQPTGILTLTSTASAKSTGSVQPSLFVPFTALSSFGRSVVSSIASVITRLFIERLFVDQDYLLQYPFGSMIIEYPIGLESTQYPFGSASLEYPDQR